MWHRDWGCKSINLCSDRCVYITDSTILQCTCQAQSYKIVKSYSIFGLTFSSPAHLLTLTESWRPLSSQSTLSAQDEQNTLHYSPSKLERSFTWAKHFSIRCPCWQQRPGWPSLAAWSCRRNLPWLDQGWPHPPCPSHLQLRCSHCS